MFERKLSIATHRYDQVKALFEGDVIIDGVKATFESASVVTEIFERMIVDEAFDVAELGFTYYLRLLDSGDNRFVALPVFPARIFRHSAVYVNKARVASPADLAGKRIGELALYGHDAGLWAKGVLADEYGFDPAAARWIIGGLDFPIRPLDYVPQPHPHDVEVVRADDGQDLGAMLEAGEIDALISADAPRCVLDGSPAVGPLFPDWQAVERDYHRRTGILPIMHLVVMRRELAEKDPGLVAAIYDGFCASKRQAMETYVKGRQFNHMDLMIPWFSAHYDAVRTDFGDDWWPYGIHANRAAIEAVLRYHFEQGLTNRRFTVEDVFFHGLSAS